ncbi:MAG TPA: hypothetical protein VKQ31_03855 [Steroidobacteraceae bacterium]|nr:hypothetical protein [Steroidobacteraceae bacterium]
MNVRLLVAASLVPLGACSTTVPAPEANPAAQPPGTRSPVELSGNDISFTSKWFWAANRHWSGMCGVWIRGNHGPYNVPRPIWIIGIEELMGADAPVVGVRAAALELLSGSSLEARPPIVALSFTLDGGSESLAARIVGRPGRNNAIAATLEAAPGHRLLDAFYDGRWVGISLSYEDGSTETLQVNPQGHGHFWNSAPSAHLHECLKNLRPIPAGVRMTYSIHSAPQLEGADLAAFGLQ